MRDVGRRTGIIGADDHQSQNAAIRRYTRPMGRSALSAC